MDEKLSNFYVPTELDKKRFWNNVTRVSRTGCWLWGGSCAPNGYGRFHWGGMPSSAHRFSYLLNLGFIPSGCIVMHSCDNPPCVNPYHLSAGTHTEMRKQLMLHARKRLKPMEARPPSPPPVGRKYGEIGIPEPGDGYDMGVFVILKR